MTKFTTAIWNETARPDDSFSRESASCFGFDIATELLPKANYLEYLYLLISGTRPSKESVQILEKLAILLANFGIRDISIRTAMNAGVGKAPSPSVLIAALSGNSGRKGGSKEISEGMSLIVHLRENKRFEQQAFDPIWPATNSPPGFTKDLEETEKFTLDCLTYFSNFSNNSTCNWLKDSRPEIESALGARLTLMGLVSAIFLDLNLSSEQSEYLYLMLRLPGAASHAMEQKALGWKSFPFFTDTVEYHSEILSGDIPDLPDVNPLKEKYLDD